MEKKDQYKNVQVQSMLDEKNKASDSYSLHIKHLP